MPDLSRCINLEFVDISKNCIRGGMAGLAKCSRLKTLNMQSNDLVWAEEELTDQLQHMKEAHRKLKDLGFAGNPFVAVLAEGYRHCICRRITSLHMLDGTKVSRADRKGSTGATGDKKDSASVMSESVDMSAVDSGSDEEDTVGGDDMTEARTAGGGGSAATAVPGAGLERTR